MPSGTASPIVRVTTGYMNRVADPVVGMASTPLGPGITKFGGQLGQSLVLGPDEIVSDTVIGTLYGGTYQYVRFKSTDTVPVRGQIVFWDLSVAEDLYQVTRLELPSVGQFLAGVVINGGSYPPIAGNYGWICVGGKVAVKFRAVLTGTTNNVGSPVYLAGAGAGADEGFADTLYAATDITAMSTLTNAQARFLGWAETAPSGGAISNVWLGFTRRRF